MLNSRKISGLLEILPAAQRGPDTPHVIYFRMRFILERSARPLFLISECLRQSWPSPAPLQCALSFVLANALHSPATLLPTAAAERPYPPVYSVECGGRERHPCDIVRARN